jgi:hypothetical protein
MHLEELECSVVTMCVLYVFGITYVITHFNSIV